MTERILDKLLAYSKEQILRVMSILLWLSLIFISFNKFINKLDYKILISPEKLAEYFLTGNYILLIAWFVCLTASYLILKYLLTNLIPASGAGMRIFLNFLIPEEYKIPLLNVYYKRAVKASREHLQKAVKFWNDEKVDDSLKDKRKLDLFIGITLKFLFLLFIVVNNFQGISYWIIVLSILLCIIFLLFLISAITSLIGKNMIHQIIESFDN